MQLDVTFLEAIAAAFGGLMLTGVIAITRLLIKISREVGHLGPSLEALYMIQPFLIRATRYQNAALKELGANGSTTSSDSCLDEAAKHLDRRLAERIGGKL